MGYGKSGYGYSGNYNQNYGQPMNSNACCGVDQWQQNSSSQNQMSSSQANVGTATTPIASAPVAYHSSVVVNPPQPAANNVVAPSAAPSPPAPATVSGKSTANIAVNPPQPAVTQAAVPAAAK